MGKAKKKQNSRDALSLPKDTERDTQREARAVTTTAAADPDCGGRGSDAYPPPHLLAACLDALCSTNPFREAMISLGLL